MSYRIYIWPNLTKEKYLPRVRSVMETLEKRGFTCLLSPENERLLRGACAGTEDPAAEADLILSVGGDGTFLRAGQTAMALRKPLCGYNAGRLGYLCALHGEDLNTFVPESLPFFEEPVLCCTLGGKEHYALSDIVAGKDYFGGTVVPGWKIGSGPEKRCIGDGLILATPLGSTGYTASAGGPVLERGCGKFALTPVCPHTGDKKACVFDDGETVTIRSLDATYSASVFADGRLLGPLGTVKIAKADFTLPVASRQRKS